MIKYLIIRVIMIIFVTGCAFIYLFNMIGERNKYNYKIYMMKNFYKCSLI